MTATATAGSAALTRVERADPEAWIRLLEADESALLDHHPLWIEAMQVAGGFRDASRQYTFADGRSFILPLAQRGPTSRAPLAGFPPGWGIGGLVGPDLDVGVVRAVANDLRVQPAVSVHVRPNPLQSHIWAEAAPAGFTPTPKRAHVVDLRAGIDAVYAAFRKSGRRGIKRADKAGIEVRVSTGAELLDRYYEDLYLSSVRRWAERSREPLPLALFRAKRRDPVEKLRRITSTLGSRARLYLGYADNELVGGNLVLCGPNAHATRGAINERGAKTNVTYALDWAAIQDACEAGSSWYQLGESGFNAELADYKERFGAIPVDYAEFRCERVPIAAVDRAARTLVKKAIRFKD